MPDSVEPRPTVLRTFRVRTSNHVGVLARVLAVLAEHGASVGDLRTVFMGPLSRIRDIELGFADPADIEPAARAIDATGEAHVLEIRDEVLDLHAGGKIEVRSRYPITSDADLRRVYTPGVGEVARRIAADPELADHYTLRANTVAIVSDGTAILGLGNLGPLASLPILEGKAAILAELAGVSGVPLAVDQLAPAEVAAAVASVARGFGLVQLEDIAAPRCFEVEGELRRRGIPVFHDDQHGTAAVVLAAVIGAASAGSKQLANARVGCIGLGAAGSAIAGALMAYLGRPVLGADVDEGALARFAAAGGIPSTLAEVMATCDVVVATTGKPGLITPEMVRPGQVILALSNPVPEIERDAALAAGAAVATDGRATNNMLAFPGLCRGGLDCGIRQFEPPIFRAAAEAIVASVPPGQLLPAPLDRSVHRRVARAVALAAEREGLATREVPPDYMLDTRR